MSEPTPRDPMAELRECLRVLMTYVDETPDDPALYDSEFLTACWQTVELTSQLMREYEELVYLMQMAVDQYQEASKATKLVTASLADMRDITRERR